MCNNVTTIKFCTCSEKEKVSTMSSNEIQMLFEAKKNSLEALSNGTYEDTYFKWTLQSFKKDESGYVIGRVIYPTDILSMEVTRESILELLNNSSCFDFAYTPKEEDYLTISERYIHLELEEHRRSYFENYMYFIFRNNEWIFGRHPLGYTYKDIKNGEIEVKKK